MKTKVFFFTFFSIFALAFSGNGQNLSEGPGNAVEFTGSGSRVVQVDHSADLSFSNQSFTVEAWINTDNFSANEQTIIAKRDYSISGPYANYSLRFRNGQLFFFFRRFGGDGGLQQVIDASPTITNGTWNHVAGVFNIADSTLKIFINGQLRATEKATTIPDIVSSPFTIGNTVNGGGYSFPFDGKIDEVRVSNYARYSSNFAVSETPLLADEYTVGLWDFNQTNQDTIRDASEYHHDAAILNSPSLVASSADLDIHSGNAAEFDGTQKYFATPDETNLNFALATDFSIEGWFNTSTISGTQTILQKRSSGAGYQIEIVSGKLRATISDGTNTDVLESTSNVSASKWNHYAFVREAGADIYLYLNGDEVDAATETITGDITNTDSLFVGSDKSSAHFNGLIDEIRMSNTMRTISGPPTSEYMSDANTVALYHFNSTGTYTEISDKSSESHVLIKRGDIALTSSNIFALQLRIGSYNPESSSEANDASNIPMLQFKLSASDVSNITINSISFSNSGTADESGAISSGGVKVYRDNNNNGVIDISDDLLGSGNPPAADDGKGSVNIGAVINAGTTQNWILAYNLDGASSPASLGETFIASLLPADINASDASSNAVTAVGTTLNSNTKTISSSPSIYVYKGANNPASQNIAASVETTVMMQFSIEASSASSADISAFSLRETGTADIDNTIDSVMLYLDKNNNGVLDIGVDSLVAKSVDPASSPFTLTPASDYKVHKSSTKHFLSVYTISGASNGNTYIPGINAGDITSAGTSITGLPFTGSTFTVSSAGNLTLTIGTNNPSSSNYSNAAQNIAMLQLKVENDNIEKIVLNSIKLTAIGSMNADTTVTSVELYDDVNGNGTVELASEPKIGNSQSFSSNITTFSSLADTLEKSETKYILAVYNLQGNASGGSEFSVSIATDVDVSVTGVTSGSATRSGMPVSGNTMTIASFGSLTITESVNNPDSRTEQNSAEHVSAVALKLAASSLEDIAVNSITFRGTGTGSFSDDITTNSIELYKDNGDGIYDPIDDQLIGIGSKFQSQAIDFNGTNQYVSVPDHPSLDLTNQLTIEAWVKPSNIPNGAMQILNKESTYEIAVRNGYIDAAIETNATGAWFWCTGGYPNILTGSGLTGDPKNEFNYYNDGLGRVAQAVNELPQMVAGTWYHVAVTFDGNAYRVFQDGELLYTIRKDGSGNPIAGTIVNTSSNVEIGRRPSGSYFEGTIDELHLSDAVRYTADYTVPSFPYSPDQQTALLLHFDEGTGTTARDLSEFQNDGTLINAVSWVESTSPIADKLVSINTTGQVINAGTSADWLLIYDYNGNGTNGENYTTKLTRAADVSAVGQTSSSTIVASGSFPVVGGTITLSNTGNLSIAEGSNNPLASTVNAGTEGVSMLQLRLTASSAEDITIDYVGLKADGIGDDNTDLDSVFLYKDENDNGIYDDLVDTRIAARGAFSADNDTMKIACDYVLSAGESEHWLVVYNIDSGTKADSTFSVSIPLNAYVEGTGNTSALSVNVSGAPVEGNEKTISTIGSMTVAFGENSAAASNESASASNLNMAQFKLTAGAAENITISEMSFKDAGTADITTDVIEARLHRDVNGNGLVDPGDPIVGTTTDFGADFGNMISLNGSNQYVQVPDDNSLDIAGNFTLEAWIYPTSVSGNQVIIAKRDNGGNEPNYELRIENRNVRVFFRNSGGNLYQVLTTTNPITVNEWQHIAGTYDGNKIRFFRNGVAIDSSTVGAQTPNVNAQDVTIGYEAFKGTSYYFSGYMDEVRISDVARYTTNFAKPTAAFTSDANTALLYHFNQTGGTTITDASSNGNDGATQNSPSFQENTAFSVKANFSGLNENIAKSASKYYILVYDLNGDASAAETFRAKINANADISAIGDDSSLPVTILGAPVTGNTKTIATLGSLTIATGDNNPGPKTITKDAQKVPMLQIKLTTSSAEAIDISSLKVNTIGTGHDVDHLNSTAGVELYVDANENGLYEDGIDQFLGQGVFDEDDGEVSLTTSNRRISSATTEHWLVVQNYNNVADSGMTFTSRVLSPNNFIATGAVTGSSITPAGSALIGGTQTISTLGSITISLGSLTPDDGFITNDASNVEAMQLQVQTSAAEAVYVKQLKFKASGTGHDIDDIVTDSVKLFDDLNNNGFYDVGVDTLLDFTNFSADNGIATFDFGGDSVYVESNTIVNWLVVYDMNATATDDETFSIAVELNNYIDAVGSATEQSIPVSGAPFNGALKTISSIGTLTVTNSPTNPASSNETNDAQGVVMMVLRLSASEAEDIRVDSITIRGEGTLLDDDYISGVLLYKDLNDNGMLDLTIDPQIDSTRVYTADNGELTFTSVADTITADDYQDYLIVYNLFGLSGPDSTFRIKINNNTKIKAKGLSGAEHDVTITGAPIYGNYKTITNSGSLTLTEGDYNIQPSNIAVNAEKIPMVQVKLTASSAEDVEVNSIVLRSGGTYSPNDDISSYGIELFQDVNNNGTVDQGVDEFIGSAEKFGSNAVTYDGLTGYAEVPHSNSISLDGTEMTMEGWFYATRTSGTNIIINKENTYEVAVRNGALNAAIETSVGNAWFWTTGPAVTADTWHHFAVTYDGTAIRVYLDGNLGSTTTTNTGGTIDPSNNSLRFARRSGTSYFEGTIDEIRISDVARYTGATYTVPSNAYVADANTVALYSFDESSGTTILDASGNDNHGVLNGGTTRVESTAGFSSNSVAISTTGQIISKGTEENWIARLSFNGSASIGETATMTISSNDVSAIGAETSSTVEVDGTSVSGGSQTFSATGSLTLSSNGPSAGNISKSSTDQPMLVVNFSAGSAEDIEISQLKFKASGSGNDQTAISDVALWEDLNKNNVIDIGVDREISSGHTFGSNDGIITINVTEVIDSASTEQWIVAYDMAGTAANNDQFQARIELANYITATGATTSNSITPSLPGGSAVVGGIQTIKTIGQLSIEVGDNNPSTVTVENSAEYHVFLQAKFTANPADSLEIDTVSVSENGTIDETTAFDHVKIYLDGDDNGILDFVNDIDLGTGSQIGNYFYFDNLGQVIAPNETKNYLIVASLNGSSPENKTIQFKIPLNDSIKAYGKASGLQAAVIGAPVAGTLITVKNIGTLTIVPGENNPEDGNIVADADEVPMMQLKLTGSDVEDIETINLTFTAQGSGDDVDAIESGTINLYKDVNNDGTYQNEIDINIGNGASYSADNGTITISTNNRIIHKNEYEYWLLTYNFNSNPVSGNTFRARILQGTDVEAVGVTSEEQSTISLAEGVINGGLRTISSVGSLSLAIGASSPVNSTIARNDQDVVMLQLKLVSSDAEDINISSATFKSSGTGDDNADISDIHLYTDMNNNGQLDSGVDTLICSAGRPFDADNDTIKFTIPGNFEVAAGNTVHWLVVYDFADNAANNATFKTSVELNSYFEATGESSGQNVAITGSPITSYTKTVSTIGTMTFELGDDNAPVANQTKDAQGVVMMQMKATVNGTEKLVLDSLFVKAEGTIDDANDISSVAIYKDNNNNGLLDLTVDEQYDQYRTFSADNGTLTFEAINDTLEASSVHNYLIIYNLADAASADETFRVKISDNNSFIVNREINGEDANVVGAPLIGNYQTITTDGLLYITEGGSNPGPANITSDAQKVTMIQMNVAASSVEDIELNAITLRSGGTVDEETAIEEYGINLYDDVNNNGLYDAGLDVFIASSQGFVNQAISLENANTQYLEAPNSSSLSINGSEMTIEGWIYLPIAVTADRYILNKENTYELMVRTGNQLSFAVETSSARPWFWSHSVGVAPVIPTATWTHFALVFDGTNFKIFIDGVLQGTITQDGGGNPVAGTVTPSNNPLRIGRRESQPGREFNGYIDELRISNSARYDSDFSLQSSEFTLDNNTMALYHFNEENGSTFFYDLSGNANHATAYNNPSTLSSTAPFTARSVNIVTQGQVIQANQSKNWIVTYDFAGTASNNQTIYATISREDISAEGASSGNNIRVSGNNVTGGQQTISELGSLTVTALGPDPGTIGTDGIQDVMFRLKLTASSADTLEVSQIKIKNNGTGNDATTISKLYVWDDLNNNGVIDEGIDLVMDSIESNPFSIDNGIATLNFQSNKVIPKGESKYWLITYNFSGAVHGSTYQARMELNSYLSVTGTKIVQPITPTTAGSFPIFGGNQTVSNVGKLTVDNGVNTPVNGNVSASEQDIVLHQIKLQANSAEDIAIDSLTLKHLGTVDFANIDSVKLFIDKDNNGQLSYVNDEFLTGAIKNDPYLRFANLEDTITMSTTKNYIVVVDLDGASDNETLRTVLNDNDSIKTTGVTSLANTAIIGAPIYSNIKTVNNIGNLIISEGENNPPDNSITNDAEDVPMIQLKFVTSDVEDIEIESITFSADGSGHDVNDITTSSIKLFKDVNQNGLFDGTDVFLQTASSYSADNGTVTLNLNSVTLPKNTTSYWLLVQSFNGTAANDKSYRTRFVQADDIVAVGVTSTEDIAPQITQAVNGGLKTISTTGTLSIADGTNNPLAGYVANNGTNISMQQVKLITGAAEAVYINKFTVKTSGTANDDTGISAVYLADDLNSNGVFDTGVDTLIIGPRTFDSDNDTIQFAFANDGKLLPAGNTSNWLVLYDLSDQNSNNETMYSSIELNTYIVATGETSSQNIAPVGAPVQGNIKTVSSQGSITLTRGANTPLADEFSKSEINLVVMQFKMDASAAEDLILNAATFKAFGTLDDVNDISTAYLYNDANHDGSLTIGIDKQVGSSAAFVTDNGEVTFSSLLDTIYAGTYNHYLLVYNMSGNASGNETFYVKIEDNTKYTVKDVDNNDAIKVGAPITSYTHTISTTGILTLAVGANNPANSNITNDVENESMVQFNLAANADEDIKINSVAITSSGSFDPRDDIADNGIILYNDVNHNGAIDQSTDVILGSSPGFVGYDIEFSSSSNTQFAYTTTTGSDDIDNYSNAFTMEAWIYPVSDGSNNIVLCKESAYEIGINGNNIQSAIYISGSGWNWDVSYGVQYNQWQHVAVTYDGTNIRLYVDGQLRSTYSRPGNIATNSNPLKIGGRSTSTTTCTAPFNGNIDEVRISNVVRYSGSTYEVPDAEFTPDDNTLGLWHINEGTGSTFEDASTSNKNMTLVDGTWSESTNAISSNKSTINISGGAIIDAGTNQDWLIGYSLSGNASIGETMAATIERDFISAVGLTSAQNLTAQGESHVTGGLKTFADVGSLQIAIVGPSAKNESGKAKFSTFILDVEANSTENILMNSFKIHGKGSVNDVTNIENVFLYQDVDKDNIVDEGGPDTLLFATGKTFASDNGTIQWDFPTAVEISAGTTQRWIVYYDMDESNPPANGKTIEVALELANYFDAVGETSAQSITPAFAGAQEFPQSAGVITITDLGSLSIQEGVNNPTASNVIPSGSDIPMLAVKLTTNSAEPVLVNSMQFLCEFSGSPIGANTNVLNASLYQDANGNASFDAGTDTELQTASLLANGNFTFSMAPAVQIDSASTTDWFVVFDYAALQGQQYKVKFLGSSYIDVEGLRTEESITAVTGQIQGGIKLIGEHATQGDGPYTNTGVWVLGMVPGSMQTVNIGHDIYLTSDQTVGAITLSAGSLDLNGYTLTLDNGSLSLTGGTFIHDDGVVRYASTSDQVVADVSYGGLIIAGSGTKSLEGATDLAGDLTIYGTLDAVSGSNYDINLEGDWTNLGSFDPQQNTVTFDGAGAQEINAGTTAFYNLVASSTGDLTNSGNTTVNNDLSISADINFVNSNQVTVSGDITGGNAASTFVNSSGATLNIAGAMLATGVLDASDVCNTINYNGSTDQDIKTPLGNQYGELILSGAGNKISEAATLLEIACDWTNNAAFNANSGSVTFNGSVSQTIGGTSQTTFNNLEIDNASDVILAIQANINTTLTLTAGDIVLGDYTLELTGETTSITGGSTASYIQADGNGFVRKNFGTEAAASRAAFTYPVGDVNYYTPFTIKINTADLTAAYLDVNLDAVKHPRIEGATSYIERYWTYSPTGFSGSIDYDMNLVYDQSDVVGTEADIRAVKVSGSTIVLGDAGSIDTGTNTLTLTGQTSFSEGTGSDEASALPVTLISFTGKKIGEGIALSWETASELNNDYFTVERLVDGDFVEIAKIQGVGYSYTITSYNTLDDDPDYGVNYYRLKQTDFDGTSQYYKTIAVNYTLDTEEVMQDIEIMLSPNPLQAGDLTVQIAGIEQLDNFKLLVYSPMGQVLFRKEVVIDDRKISNYKIPGKAFTKDGIYLVLISTEFNTISQKVVINK